MPMPTNRRRDQAARRARGWPELRFPRGRVPWSAARVVRAWDFGARSASWSALYEARPTPDGRQALFIVDDPVVPARGPRAPGAVAALDEYIAQVRAAYRTAEIGFELAWGPPPPEPVPAWERELARDAGAIAEARLGLLRRYLARAGVDASRDLGAAVAVALVGTVLRDAGPLSDWADAALASTWRSLRPAPPVERPRESVREWWWRRFAARDWRPRDVA